MRQISFLQGTGTLLSLIFLYSLLGCEHSRVNLTPEENLWLKTHGDSIILEYDPQLPPMEFERNGEYQGIAADVIREIEKSLAIRIIAKPTKDWGASEERLRTGEISLLGAISRNPERDRFALFTEAYIRTPSALLAKNETPSVKSLDDLIGKRIAVVEKFAIHYYLLAHTDTSKITVVTVPNRAAGIMKVVIGEADYFGGNLGFISWDIMKMGIPNLYFAGELPLSNDFRIAVSKKYPLLHSAIYKAVKAIPKEKLDKIKQTWIANGGAHPVPSVRIWLIIALLGITIAILLIRQYRIRREAELTVIRFGKKLADMTSQIPHAMMYQVKIYPSGERKFLFISEGIRDLHGVSAEQVLKNPQVLYEQIQPDDRKLLITAELEALAKMEVFRFEARFNHPDGSVRWSLLTSTPCKEPDGSIIWDGIDVDITDRRVAELKVKESKAILDSLFNGTDDRIWYVECDKFTIQGFNKSFAEYFRENHGVETTVGDPIETFFSDPIVAEKWRGYYQKTLDEGSVAFEWEAVYTQKTFLFNMFLMQMNGVPFAVAVFCKDITHMKQMAKSIRESEERYRSIVETAPMGIFRRAITGEYEYLNLQMARQFDCSTVEEYLHHYGDIRSRWAHPEKHAEFIERLHNERHISGYEVEVLLNSGKHKWIQLHAFIDDSNKTINGFSIDVTEQHIAEEKQAKLTEQLHQSQKMESIGQLAGGVAHDFNNALSGIIGASELVLGSGNLTDLQRKYLNMILTAAERAGSLTKKLLVFSRRGTKASSPVNCVTITEDTVALLRQTVDKAITISIENRAQQTTVIGDDSQLQNALMNIGINASHAMPSGGELRFTLENLDLDEAYCHASPFVLKPGPYLEIAVRDTGTGMSPEIAARIFEPFFSTKEQGKGTGLGLAMVYGAIQDHGGAITVYSEVGSGTVFHLYLPLTGETVGPKSEALLTVQGTGTILVVDDEELLRVTASALLESLGYQVILAPNGQDGVHMFLEKKNEIDLIILDMIMPVMGGREAFGKLREINPKIPIVIASGFAKEEAMEELKKQGVNGFLNKPFRKAELAEAVGRILGSHNGILNESRSTPPQLTRDDLQAIPLELKEAVARAVTVGDSKMIKYNIQSIARLNPELGASLVTLAELYAYDQLIQLLGKE